MTSWTKKYLIVFEGIHDAQHADSSHWCISWATLSFPLLMNENLTIKNYPQMNTLSKNVNTTKALASLVRINGIPQEALFFK